MNASRCRLPLFTLPVLICISWSPGAKAVGDESIRADVFGTMIVGGFPIPIEEAPWQVSLQNKENRHFCGGSIIGENWILTANHCVADASAGDLKVVAGTADLDRSEEGQRRLVEEIIRYPGYVGVEWGKDVALLKLREPLELNGTTVAKIRLVDEAMEEEGAIFPGTMADVSGWGDLFFGGPETTELRMVRVPIVSDEEADAYYADLTDDQLAAGYLGTEEKDSCHGDSGGPLTVEDGGIPYLAGVVSWGEKCAFKGFPGMYAKVSFFAAWIAEESGSTTNRISGPLPRTGRSERDDQLP